MFIFYGIGFGFYGSAIPESLRPGLWDYRGGSHFAWHLAVLLAVGSYEAGVQQMLLQTRRPSFSGWARSS